MLERFQSSKVKRIVDLANCISKKYLRLILKLLISLISILFTKLIIETDMNKTWKIILECIKAVALTLLGYYGGNAVM